MAITQDNRIAAIGTPLGKDVLCLESFHGHEELGRLFQYQARLFSENDSITFEDIIGHSVTVRLESTMGDSPQTRYFNGIVSRFSQLPSTHNYAVYQATIVPWFWLLTRTSDCRIWSGADQTRTVPDIIKALFSVRGFTAFEDKLTGSYTPWDYCVQYRETDFNFLSRLMEQEGIYYYFKHENGQHTLVLVDDVSSAEPTPNYDTIQYMPQGGGSSDLEHIRNWSMDKQLAPCKYVHNDFDFENPTQDLCTDPAVKTRSHAQADFEIYDYPGEYTQASDGAAWAQVRIDELQTQYHLLHGGGDARGMAAGCAFTLADLPRDDQNQEYLIVSVSHNIHMAGYESEGHTGSGDSYQCSFAVLPTTEQFRPARKTPKPLVQGPQTAMVAGPAGDEIYTDQYGRVKLKYHWDRYSSGDDKSSFWVRVSHAWAGSQWGAIYIPRIGQEVIVEYLEGDPDQPIITGRVYNGGSMPPYPLPDQKTKSTLKSNSTIGGQGFNEIRFEDDAGNEQVFIHAQKDQDARVKNDSREWIGHDRHLIVVNNQTEQVQANKHLTVQGNRVTQVQGNQSEAVLGDNKTSVGGNDHLAVTGDQKVQVSANHNLNAGQNSNNQCGNDLSLKAGMTLHEKSGMNHLVDAGMTVHIKGGMSVIIEAGMELSLKAGGNFIDIGPAGVAISGTLVMINSGGSSGSGPDCSPNPPDSPDTPDSPDAPDTAADADSGDVTAAEADPDDDESNADNEVTKVDDSSGGSDSDSGDGSSSSSDSNSDGGSGSGGDIDSGGDAGALDASKTWMSGKGSAATYGDDQNNFSVDSYGMSATSGVSVDPAKKSLDVNLVTAGAQASLLSAQASGTAMDGMAQGSASAKVLAADAHASAGATLTPDSADLHANAGASLDLVSAQASGQIKVPLFGHVLTLGAVASGQIGASAQAQASAGYNADQGAYASFGAKAGLGLGAGLNFSVGFK